MSQRARRVAPVKMLPSAPAPTMTFGRACANAPRGAGKPLAEASSTLANRACLIRGAGGEANCAHRSAASGDRDAHLSFVNAYYRPPSRRQPRNRASAVHSRVDQSVGESAAKATGLARLAGTRVVLGDLTCWLAALQAWRVAGGPAGANEHGRHGQLLI